MKRKMLFLGCLVVSLFAPLCWAEDPAKDEPSIPTMEEVVVTATRQEEKISSVPANVTVITENDIKNSTANDIPDLLRTQVGFMSMILLEIKEASPLIYAVLVKQHH